jgi:hypothetical protein
MFAQTLFVQWKWNRDFLAFFTIIGFVAPILILSIALPHLAMASPRELVTVGGIIGVTVATVAVVAGLTIAWQGYSVDDRIGHIYALSLPVTRRRALVMRAATAVVLLVIPTVGVWAGAMIATARASLPPTLQSYAGSLALKAILAAWFAHCCMFALRYAAGRRAKAVMGTLAVGAMLLALLAVVWPATQDPIARVGGYLISIPGPFGVLFGRWTMIDV